VSKREIDLGRLAQQVGRRIEDEGQATSQRLHDWKRTEQIPADSTRGGGGGNGFQMQDRQQDRLAGSMSAEWLALRLQLDHTLRRMDWMMDQAKANHMPLDKHRTAAQVEADGNCGSCWKSLGEIVPVTERPSGEPYYRGRCRFCGSWPGGDPPKDVLETRRRAGKDGAVKVRAS
jgi:hypothetical protein